MFDLGDVSSLRALLFTLQEHGVKAFAAGDFHVEFFSRSNVEASDSLPKDAPSVGTYTALTPELIQQFAENPPTPGDPEIDPISLALNAPDYDIPGVPDPDEEKGNN